MPHRLMACAAESLSASGPLRATVHRDLMEILACPVCKGDLTLTAERETDEVLEGTLYCPHCEHTYEIRDGIPNLLPPDFK